MTTTSSRALESPALKRKGEGYPFGDRVPKSIRMKCTVRPDMCFNEKDAKIVAVADVEYPAWVNIYGAVVAITAHGEIGVKPDEFEVASWHKAEAK